MEIYEKINNRIRESGINKKELVNRVLALEPKLKNTGEIPTEKTIYAYLNGTSNLKLELIPYIAEALNITEQEIFDDTEQTRLKYLKHILKNPSSKEIELIKYKLGGNDIKIKNSILADTNHGNIIINSEYFNSEVKEVIELLKYAPIPFLNNLTSKLKEMQKLTKSV